MQSFIRFLFVCSKLLPPFVIFSFTKKNPRSKKFQSAIVKIRKSFQELGPTYIKLGQMLSSRSDIVGNELAEELRNLLDKEFPISFGEIQKILEDEYHTPLRKIFISF